MDNLEKRKSASPEMFAMFVKRIREAGTDNLSFFKNGYELEGGYSLQQNPDEFAALMMFLYWVCSPYTTYLEIGSASGGTARMLCETLPFEYMVSIDDGKHHRYPELPKNFEGLPIEHLQADSHQEETRQWLRDLTIGSFVYDIIFIDGDHSEAGVWQDVQLCLPHSALGTFVIFHDTVACDGVKKAWQRGARENLWVPVAEYVGAEVPLGIGVGFCL